MKHTFFRRSCTGVLDDEALRSLQAELLIRPDAGALVPGTGGLRKIRWAGSGRGKRGGVRVIYYWMKPDERIYLLIAFAKNKQSDLSAEQKRLLRKLMEEK